MPPADSDAEGRDTKQVENTQLDDLRGSFQFWPSVPTPGAQWGQHPMSVFLSVLQVDPRAKKGLCSLTPGPPGEAVIS